MLGRKGVKEKLCKLGQKAREGRKEGREGQVRVRLVDTGSEDGEWKDSWWPGRQR